MRPSNRTDLSADYVRSILSYEPVTGQFTRLAGPFAGPAGTTNGNGYRLLSINCRKYRAHRIAWLWMTGEWPDGEVDHINGVRDDNRWSNLRDVPMQINQQNRRRAMKTNLLGVQGVSATRSGRFKATVSNSKVEQHLGTFSTPEEAHRAYLDAKRIAHEGCTL